MSDVGHEQGADIVGDSPKSLEIDDPAVGTGTANDQLWSVLSRDGGDRVVVNGLRLTVDSIGHDFEIPARVGEGVPMGQVPAARKVHAHERVAGGEHGKINRRVGLSTAVRLDVDPLGAEELFGPFDCQALGLVHPFAAAVVAAARIALGVLVGEHGAGRFEDRSTGEVLRSDELQAVSLPVEFTGDGPLDLRIGFGDRALVDH